MNTWQLISEIFHGASFYWKKFFLFLLFFALIIGGGLWYKANNTSEAEFQFAETPKYISVPSETMNIEVKENGQVIINGKNSPKALKLYPDYDEISLVVLDNPGVYVNSFLITINLPKPVRQDQVEQIIYAIHGVDSYGTYMDTPKTLVYEAKNISPTATLSISARLKDKSILTPSLGKKIGYFITNVPPTGYFIFSISIPIITLLIMLSMILERRRDQLLYIGAAPLNQAPDMTSPALAGILIDAQMGSRELSAILIDLAARGYIFITRKGKNFSFGKRKNIDLKNSDLKDFEKVLLEKIFLSDDYKSTRTDVEMRVGRHIFSRKIAQVYLEIYNEATRAGYFVKNPAAVHRRFRNIGIILFLLGGLGYIYTALYSPDPKFSLFFWAGEMLASTVIIRLAGLMPTRSPFGSKVLRGWMAFRNYLKLNKEIEAGAQLEDLYIRNLPYAIVFGVEAEWTRRFLNKPFTKPDWYESEESVTTIERFTAGLFPLINFVGEILAKAHEPTVE